MHTNHGEVREMTDESTYKPMLNRNKIYTYHITTERFGKRDDETVYESFGVMFSDEVESAYQGLKKELCLPGCTKEPNKLCISCAVFDKWFGHAFPEKYVYEDSERMKGVAQKAAMSEAQLRRHGYIGGTTYVSCILQLYGADEVRALDAVMQDPTLFFCGDSYCIREQLVVEDHPEYAWVWEDER